jgi:hypothetical protein
MPNIRPDVAEPRLQAAGDFTVVKTTGRPVEDAEAEGIRGNSAKKNKNKRTRTFRRVDAKQRHADGWSNELLSLRLLPVVLTGRRDLKRPTGQLVSGQNGQHRHFEFTLYSFRNSAATTGRSSVTNTL